MIYLDNAATTLVKPKSVLQNVRYAVNHLSSPGRGQYKYADEAGKSVFELREKAGSLFNVPEPENVVITFNATHALNMAIASYVKKGSKAVISGYEHNAVTRPLYAYGADVTVVSTPLFDVDAAEDGFNKIIDSETNVVVCTAVSNVFGYALPIAEIAGICREKGVPLIIDASQGAGVIDIDFQTIGASFMAMPGHKALYGPQGTGLLLCGDSLKPFMHGGTGSDSQNRLMPDYLPDVGEAGTHNMPGIYGLCAGLDFVISKTPKVIGAYEKKLAMVLAEKLKSIDEATVYCDENFENQTGVLSFTVKDMDCVDVADRLARYGICVRAGMHCAPFAHKTAGTDKTGTVRVSFSAFNRPDDCELAYRAVRSIIKRKI